MKPIRLLVLSLVSTLTAFSQTNTYPFPSSGNVGIGTTAPEATLDVNGSIIARGLYSFVAKAPAGYWGFNHDNFFAGRHGDIYGRGFSSDAIGIFNGSTTAEDIVLFNRNNPGADVLVLKASGNVGIGTTSPIAKLHVRSNGDSSQILWNCILQNPTNEPPSGYGVGIRLQNSVPENGANEPHKWAGVAAVSNGPWSNKTDLTFYTNNFDEVANSTSSPIERIRILANSGNVGIGTSNPTHKLAVNGTVKAKEVIVETTGWSDYVFADNYALQPLAEVEAHIKTNKHLPGIPSAIQVAEQGVSVGYMQARLLAKIEELTLHQIAQEKELAALRTEVRALRDNQR
jgi:hypothetical protein